MYRVRVDVPHGNALALPSRRPDEVVFSADPRGAPECLWFRFRVERNGGASGGRMRLVLANSHNLLGGGSWPDEDPRNIRPVVRRPGGDWTRLPAGRKEAQPDGRFNVAWTVPAPAPWLDVAVCYPYGTPEIDGLLRDCRGALKSDTIGASLAGRPLARLSSDYGRPGSKRPGIYIVARQHSGEVPGSWVLDGMLRRFVRLGRRAPLVWAVPLSNIDGVERGDYGKDNFPWDLNRAWGEPPMRHETLVIQQDFNRWMKRCVPRLALDLHGPGLCEAEGIYASLPDGRTHPDWRAMGEPWANKMVRALGRLARRGEPVQGPYYPSRWPDGPQFKMFACKSGVPGVLFEIPYALAGRRVFTRGLYRECGRRLADAVVAHLGRKR